MFLCLVSEMGKVSTNNSRKALLNRIYWMIIYSNPTLRFFNRKNSHSDFHSPTMPSKKLSTLNYWFFFCVIHFSSFHRLNCILHSLTLPNDTQKCLALLFFLLSRWQRRCSFNWLSLQFLVCIFFKSNIACIR